MTTTLDHLIAADDFQRRMKEGIAAVKDRAERLGYNFKRNVAKTYYETVDWPKKYLTAAEDRRQRLEEQLSIEELIEENEDQLLEAYAYFLSLSPGQQQRTAPQFKQGLERVMALRERNRKRAQRMLAKRFTNV